LFWRSFQVSAFNFTVHTAGDNQKNAIALQEIDVKFSWKWEK